MKPKLVLRIAAGCVFFFAFGHSVGHFTRHNVTDRRAQEVLQIMTEHKFDMFGQMRSFDENYNGMSLNLILTLLTLAYILWIASGQITKHPTSMTSLLIPIAVCLFGFGITSYLYFFIFPAITCVLASALTSIAIVRRSKISDS